MVSPSKLPPPTAAPSASPKRKSPALPPTTPFNPTNAATLPSDSSCAPAVPPASVSSSALPPTGQSAPAVPMLSDPPNAPSAPLSSSTVSISTASTASSNVPAQSSTGLSNDRLMTKKKSFRVEVEESFGELLDGRFNLTGYISGGTHGLVFCAEDVLTSKHVAVKIGNPDDDQIVFESLILSKLGQSAYTPDFIFSGLGVRRFRYLVFSKELYDVNFILKQFLKISLGMDLGRVLMILHDAILALEFLHRRGIIHRDLHEKNLLVTNSPGKSQILVCDFGLSAVRGPDGELKCEDDTSEMNHCFQTPVYVRRGNPCVETDDLYSLVYLTLSLRASKLSRTPAKRIRKMKERLVSNLNKTLPRQDRVFKKFFGTVFAQPRNRLPDYSAVLRTIHTMDDYDPNLDIRLPDPLPFPLTQEGLAPTKRRV